MKTPQSDLTHSLPSLLPIVPDGRVGGEDVIPLGAGDGHQTFLSFCVRTQTCV